MSAANHILRGGICFLFMAVFAGCSGTAANIPPLNGPARSLRPGYEAVYYPKLQPNATLDSFQQKLNRILKNNNTIFVSGDIPHDKYWHFLEHINLYSDRIEFHKNKVVFNSQIEIQHDVRPSFLNIRLFDYNLLNCPIVVERSKEGGFLSYVIALKGLMTFHFHEGGIAATMADTLYFLQQEQKKSRQG